MKKGKFAAVLFIVFFLLAVALICFWLTSKDTAAEPPAADVSGSMEPQIVVGTPNAGGTTGNGSSSGSTFAYEDEAVVTAAISGEVASLQVAEGDWVDKNQVIVVLSSDTLADEIQSASESLRNAELSLESQYDQLDDYTITSPISGTIIDKNYKAGETTESNQVLCSIYDLSYLTMTLSVDELDIADIAVGQTVSITADAVRMRPMRALSPRSVWRVPRRAASLLIPSPSVSTRPMASCPA